MSNETLSTAEKNRLNQIFKTYTDIFFENRALRYSEVKVSVQDIKKGKTKVTGIAYDKNYNAIFKMQGLMMILK